jgi:hypothetical protein
MLSSVFLTAVVKKPINGGSCEVGEDPLDGVTVERFDILAVFSYLTNSICDSRLLILTCWKNIFSVFLKYIREDQST